jgi:hypothetical protein
VAVPHTVLPSHFALRSHPGGSLVATSQPQVDPRLQDQAGPFVAEPAPTLLLSCCSRCRMNLYTVRNVFGTLREYCAAPWELVKVVQ